MVNISRRVAVVVIGLPLVLVSCKATSKPSSSVISPQSPPSVSSTPTLASAVDQPLPLDGYLLSPQQSSAIGNAYTVLLSRCMARFGFTQPLPDVGGPNPNYGPSSSLRISGHFGPQSASFAARWGYHPEGGLPADDPVLSVPKVTPEMATALSGSSTRQKFGPGGQVINGQQVPDHGCVGEANKRLTGAVDGSAGVDAQLATDLEFETMTRSEQDSRVRAVFAKWSACMANRGYHYADPLAALDDPQWGQTRLATQKEIQTAVADQACRQENNVVGVWYAVDYAYEKQAVDAHAEALGDVIANIQAQLNAAAQAMTE
jgi:hypothetical protein